MTSTVIVTITNMPNVTLTAIFIEIFISLYIHKLVEMRREFILVLLGIICISTLSSLLSGYVQIETDKILLDTVVGAVGAGNFSYWQLGHTGPLLVELTSLSGDADLYVSDTVRYVEPNSNFHVFSLLFL